VIGKGTLRRMAELAALDFDETEIAGLTRQLTQILEHMQALETAVAGLDPVAAPTGAAPLRSDEPAPAPLALPPSSMAPAWDQDLYIVPRLPCHDEPARPPDTGTGTGP
jgi:aspartyl/glutamyl-tRNA(Asn/Gln) amidotransferase C subunit